MSLTAKRRVQALLGAVRGNNVDRVRHLIEEGDDGDVILNTLGEIRISQDDIKEYTAILCAARFGFDNVVAFLLNQPAVDVNPTNPSEATPLVLACYYGHEATALSLLRHPNININKADADGHTPLMMASLAGLKTVVDKLLAKLDSEAVDQPGYVRTTNSIALRGQSRPFRDCGIARGVSWYPTQSLWYGRTPLRWASGHNGNPDVVRFLLDHDVVDANGLDFWGQTAMHLAVKNKNESCVRVLIGRVDLSIEDNLDQTALMIANKQGYTEIARILGQTFEDPTQAVSCDIVRGLPPDVLAGTPHEAGKSLLQAVQNGQNDIALKLLELDAININVRDETGDTVFIVACLNSKLRIVDAILGRKDFHETINEKGDMRRTAFAQSCQMGLLSVVARLLQEPRIDINATDEIDDTALTLACFFGCTGVVELLLALPPESHDINWQILSTGNTALSHAASEGHTEIVRMLLQFPGIDASICNVDNMRPFDLALENKHYSVVHQFLLTSNACDPQEFVELLSALGPFLTHESAMKILLLNLPFEVLSGTLAPRSSHSHSWTTFLDFSSKVPPHVRISCFEALVASPEYVSVVKDIVCQELAFSTDQDGRKAIEITDATTRSYLFSQLYFCSRYELFQGPPVHVSNTAVVVMAYDHGLCEQVFDENAKHGELTQDGFVKCSQLLGRLTAERTSATQKKHLRAKEAWEMEFRLWDTDNSGKISKAEFVKYGAKYFGGKIKVALKFMKHKSEYKRELDSRKYMSDSFALQCLPSVDEATFQACVAHLAINDDMNMSSYRHLLVMPAADRSLVDIHLRERPSEMKIKAIVHEVATTLAHLHERNLVHGDLKKLNILRVENKFKLIDFDATTRVGQSIGAKFSSGILPPELFHELNSTDEVAAYEAYWADYREDKMVWNKIKPKKKFVVKSYRPEMDVSLLPYE
ncbi:Aste57867_1794 [Aphanomyces stellatus]|uniref:Aste57867_1794 protein n=1 Tax=Aphanomyces stellatus TaxID=120398 RepID=A0A485KAB5_9STRA|nr:hypothetical protein As57867_001792 [Aphanomyces stellatus]VFT79003.1 Aste57867_1794 [Aphanomyces stellatus]